jgi:hypothetical protein
MKDFGSRADVERALTELGRQMALRDADHIAVVCCGASALCVLGLLARRTLDIDAIGLIGSNEEIASTRRDFGRLRTTSGADCARLLDFQPVVRIVCSMRIAAIGKAARPWENRSR